MVSFSNFQRLDPVARDVAIELLANAQGQPPSFMAFMYRWMAFNGWMSAVTLKDTDREMIDAFVAAPRLIDAFDQLMAGDPNFRQMVTEFTALWPVLNVRSVRAKLGYDAFRQHDRAALLALCAAANVKQQPSGWVAEGRPSWEQLLRTIYQVRCNLFHGEKSPQSLRDRDLVLASDHILAHFIAATGCFDWHDH
ncbi:MULTISPECIES: hypothetical protein [Erythrobacteraceae]|nr:hypothetical protein [Aurantiacibacter atlanticus]